MSVDIDLSLGLVGTNSISFISSVRLVLVVGLFILEVVKVLLNLSNYLIVHSEELEDLENNIL